MKKVQIPSERNYLPTLTEKIELDIKQMQCQAIYFNDEKGRKDKTVWYGITSTACPGKLNGLVLLATRSQND